jgi:cytochrome bd-type quinol oxidase subunit 2
MQQLTGALFAAASLITPFFMGTVVGAVATGQVPVSTSAPHVFADLTGIALPLVAISIAAGIAVLGMLWVRWYHAIGLRATAALAVATVWGWGLAQYPYLFPLRCHWPQAARPRRPWSGNSW